MLLFGNVVGVDGNNTNSKHCILLNRFTSLSFLNRVSGNLRIRVTAELFTPNSAEHNSNKELYVSCDFNISISIKSGSDEFATRIFNTKSIKIKKSIIFDTYTLK